MSKHYVAEVHEYDVNGMKTFHSVENFPEFQKKLPIIEETFHYYLNLPKEIQEDFVKGYQSIQQCIQNYKNNAKLCFSDEHLDIHLRKIMEAVEKLDKNMKEEFSALSE